MPTKVTVVLPDGTEWEATAFTQIEAPKEVDLASGESVEVKAE